MIKAIKAIKQFIKDRVLFKQAAQDKDLQAKAKYEFEHREDNMLSIIDCLAIVCGVLIIVGIVWCLM